MNSHSDSLPARHAALAILDGVLTRRQALDMVLDHINPQMNALEPRDRAFARMLAMTCLRRLGQIDAILTLASGRAAAPTPILLHHIVRLGIAQLLFMDVPDYAAVDTSVRLANESHLSRQGGFVNAVLRHVGREGKGWLKDQDAATLNTPAWLMDHWRADYGDTAAHEMASANLTEAPLDLTLKDQTDADKKAAALDAAILPTGTLRRIAGGLITDLPGFDQGAWWVQDASAALPARLMGDVNGQTVLDLCAAPGGKTAQLAAAGATVIALDRSAKRLARLRGNIDRLGLSDRVQAETADAATWKPKHPATHILLDAPCTATGTIRRNPDVPHLKTPRDMDGLMETQARLLDASASMLAPGGVLVYCTCSLQKDEGERQVEKFLARTPAMRRYPIRTDEVGGLDSAITPDGDVRLLPFHLAALGGMDGFYIARMRKDA